MVTKNWDVLSLILKKSIVFYALGINQYQVDLKKKTIHAEVDAMNQLKKREKSKKIIIVVFRINNAGTKYLMAKPCCHCMHYMKITLAYKNYKVKKAYYTDNDGNFQPFSI